MEIGQHFPTFAEFKRTLETWSKETFQTFTVRNSKRLPEDHRMAASLEYKTTEYGCAYGGEPRWRGEGKRPVQRSRRNGCEVFFKVGLLMFRAT